MQLAKFFKIETPESWRSFIAMTLISSVANGALLVLIKAGTSAVASKELSSRLLPMFIVTIFVTTRKYALSHGIIIVEGMVKRLPVCICDQFRKSEPPFIAPSGKGAVYPTVFQEANLNQIIAETLFSRSGAGS